MERNDLPVSEHAALPGMNIADIRTKGLLENATAPTTVQEAETFLRKHCVVTLTWKPNFDEFRVTLKNSTQKQQPKKGPKVKKVKDGRKIERTVDLPIADRSSWEAKYIEVAVEMHGYWLEIERKKLAAQQ